MTTRAVHERAEALRAEGTPFVHARVVRGGVPIFDGKMSTLRHYQNEVDEIKVGSECGIRLGDFDEYLEGDLIECYTLEKVAQDL